MVRFGAYPTECKHPKGALQLQGASLAHRVRNARSRNQLDASTEAALEQVRVKYSPDALVRQIQDFVERSSGALPDQRAADTEERALARRLNNALSRGMLNESERHCIATLRQRRQEQMQQAADQREQEHLAEYVSFLRFNGSLPEVHSRATSEEQQRETELALWHRRYGDKLPHCRRVQLDRLVAEMAQAEWLATAIGSDAAQRTEVGCHMRRAQEKRRTHWIMQVRAGQKQRLTLEQELHFWALPFPSEVEIPQPRVPNPMELSSFGINFADAVRKEYFKCLRTDPALGRVAFEAIDGWKAEDADVSVIGPPCLLDPSATEFDPALLVDSDGIRQSDLSEDWWAVHRDSSI